MLQAKYFNNFAEHFVEKRITAHAAAASRSFAHRTEEFLGDDFNMGMASNITTNSSTKY
jgi:hypothetical protein